MQREWFTDVGHWTRRELGLGLLAELVPGISHALRVIAPGQNVYLRVERVPTRERWEAAVEAAVEYGRALEALWPTRLQSADWRGAGVTLVVPSAQLREDTLDVLTDVLVPDLVDAVVVSRRASASGRWSWPLRVGVVASDGGLGPARSLLTHRWHGVLFKIVRPDRSAGRLDLLVLETGGAEPVDRIAPLQCSAAAVVLLGAPSATQHAEINRLEFAGDLAHSVVVARQSGFDPREWLEAMMEGLAHARPFDQALFDVARHRGLARPLVLGDRRWLPALEVRHVAESNLRGWTKAARSEPLVTLPPRLQDDLALKPLVDVRGLATAATKSIESLSFDRERMGATTLGLAIGALASSKRRSARRGKAGQRVFRARLRGEEGRVDTGPLIPGRCFIDASIGRMSDEWLGSPQAFPTPDAPKDDPDKGWRLRVWAWEPTCLPKPVVKELWLPSKVDSEVVSFAVDVPAEVPEAFGARVTIVHGNRVLQTGLLSVQGSGEVTWEIHAAPVPVLAGLNRDRWFDASIVLNDDVLGESKAFLQQGDMVGDLDLPHEAFTEFTEKVSSCLATIADNPEHFTSIDSPATLKLLRSLAQPGASLYRAIVKGTEVDEKALGPATRIQIVQARSLTFLPAEFLYRHPAPADTATLCPGAKPSLDGQQCQIKHDNSVVCTSGFWSLDKVIERHVYAKGNGLKAPYKLLSKGVEGALSITPLANVLYAASEVADEFDPTVSASIEKAVKRAAGSVTRVATWGEWRTQVAASDRSMLLALPHHDAKDLLFIGKDSTLKPVHIDRALVDPRESANPIVMLIGCKTLLTRYLFDDIVHAFAWEGARIVVTTYATVLGRHVGPAMEVFFDVLRRRLDQGPVRMGDVLLEVRRKLLLEGKPMALGLTAYGDADVLLTAS